MDDRPESSNADEPEKVTVNEVMSGHVLTAYSHSSVRKAIETMASNAIGSVVVVDSSGPRGVFTERDLLSKVLAKGRDPDGALLMEVLSPLFVAISPTATLMDAAKTMIEKKSGLMVFEGGDLVGMVTATDIVRHIQRMRITIGLSSVIASPVFTELPETPLATVVKEMDKRRIGSVLAAEEEARPYGIFTERDLIAKVLARKLSLEFAVGELASVPLITAGISVDGVEASRIMMSKHIRRLPLTRDRAIVGIVTARDVVEAFARST
ncbi:MAG: CBS domain-containing protein [Nitrososphaerales archaeon]|nr:CBS domain-containing protein [Nitrososphaerales archaeon]